MKTIQKVLLHLKSGKKYYVKDPSDDFHTSEGTISSKDLTAEKEVKSNKGEKFLVLNPHFADLWESLQRGPQVLIQKDIGLIIAKTAVNRTSLVVDAGGGSGSLCLSLANVCQHVTTYEVNKEHYEIILKNQKLFGIENLTVKNENVYHGIKEKEVDVITLDLPEPWRVIEHAEKSLRLGGFLVVYLPNILQMKQFIDAAQKTHLKIGETVELLERQWKIEDNIARPEFQMLGHTGFLTFCRRV